MKKFLITLSLLYGLSIAYAADAQNDPFGNDPFFNDPFGDDIFKEMLQLQKKMDAMFEKMHKRMLQRSQRAIGPVGTFKISGVSGFEEKGDHYLLHTSIPEGKENHIDIKTENGMIYITAKIVEKKEEKSNGSLHSFSSVRVWQNAFSLPKDADPSQIDTKYEKGKLVITIAKKKAGETKEKIEIKKEKASASQKLPMMHIKSDLPTMG